MKKNKTIYWSLLAVLCFAAGYFWAEKGDFDVFAAEKQPMHKGDMIVVPLSENGDRSCFAVIDVRLEKIMIYELAGRANSTNKLKLAAVRNFSYDKLLEQYNNAAPTVDMIREKLLNAQPVSKQDLTDMVKESTD